MKSSKVVLRESANWENTEEDSGGIVSGAKIHRAGILTRILHSLSIYKMEWSFSKIRAWAGIMKKRYERMGLGINRVFRRNAFEHKFFAMQKIKQELLEA
jgi:hypothetical protein